MSVVAASQLQINVKARRLAAGVGTPVALPCNCPASNPGSRGSTRANGRKSLISRAHVTAPPVSGCRPSVSAPCRAIGPNLGATASSANTMTEPSNAARYTPPAWVTGHISHGDAAFLAGLVKELTPDAVVEIGVASGCSSAVLLEALASVHGAPVAGNPWLYSFDAIDHCYFDPSKRVGAAVDEMAPRLRDAWRLTIDNGLAARRLLSGNALTCAFIDANHCHPWPTLDLLALLPVLRQGAWVALHDISLSRLNSSPECQVHGAEYLFDEWPWSKRAESTLGNIGAIRLEGSGAETFDHCMHLLAKPWQVYPPAEIREALGLPERFLGNTPAVHAAFDALRRALPLQAGAGSRRLIIWGAGQAGRDTFIRLRDAGFQVDGFADRSPARQGQRLYDLDVRDPASLWAGEAIPFVAACGLYAGEIARDLQAHGFVEGNDFVALTDWR
jgi:hypothetical protein